MSTKTTLTNAAGHQIDYEYRFNRALLMFTNFNPLKHTEFADSLESHCKEIKSIEKLIRYDEQSGAIVATMHIGYDYKKSDEELFKAFHSHFTTTSIVLE